MAGQTGATPQEVAGAAAMNLQLTGLAALLDSLTAVLEGYEGVKS